MAVTDMLRALQVKANIIADKTVGLMEISSEVHDGVVILTGEVETEQQKHVAEELAYEVDGIYEVQNEIAVVKSKHDKMGSDNSAHIGYSLAEGDVGDTAFAISGDTEGAGSGLPVSEQFPGQFTDEEIEREVKGRLDSQNELDATQVEARSVNQIIRLTGFIATQQDLNRLLDMVLNVRGVMGINSDVKAREGEEGTPKG